MRKRIVLYLAAFLLCACTKVTGYSEDRLVERLRETEKEPVMQANYAKDLYSYYLQPCIGRRSADRVSTVFVMNGDTFVLTLNAAQLINDRYYEGTAAAPAHPAEELKISEIGGDWGTEEAPAPYSVSIYRIGETYYAWLEGGYVVLFGSSNAVGIVPMAQEMLRIARTVVVDRQAVTAAFSRKETITYHAKKVELFTNIAPENGEISELFSDHYSAGNTGRNEGDEYSGSGRIETDDDPVQPAEDPVQPAEDPGQ
ncbi:MAG: hypothetical protein IKG46_03165 [Solobacterium sp.]|nr:hypothetical protein [Solobacterium sp.]